jgi:hypothetical protein
MVAIGDPLMLAIMILIETIIIISAILLVVNVQDPFPCSPSRFFS